MVNSVSMHTSRCVFYRSCYEVMRSRLIYSNSIFHCQGLNMLEILGNRPSITTVSSFVATPHNLWRVHTVRNKGQITSVSFHETHNFPVIYAHCVVSHSFVANEFVVNFCYLPKFIRVALSAQGLSLVCNPRDYIMVLGMYKTDTLAWCAV